MQKKLRTIYLITIDMFLINLAFYLAFYLRFDGVLPPEHFHKYLDNILAITTIKIIVFYYFKLYKNLWKYASIEELVQIVVATVVANAAILSYLFIKQAHLPRSIYILVTMIDMMLIGGVRFSYRALRRVKNRDFKISSNEKRVMIIGAGDAGAMVIKELKNHKDLNSKPVAVIDDDEKKEGQRINGVPVLGQRWDIVSVARKKKIDEIIIAIPSASKKDIREIVEECKRTKCKLKILPGMFELIDGKVTINDIRDVQIEDLLGREQVKLNIEEISGYLRNKKVLVTGGGGSIGSELCRQIAKFKPSELIILDIYENNAYDLQNELKRKYKDLNLKVVIASIREKERIEEVMDKFRPDVVFHAAAHKHVPLMEDNPKEAVKNNVFGTLNVAQAADKYGVKKFVLISTDKAVNPTNVMGATKRICEMIVQSIDKVSKTEFVAVRFGNVLGSNGSVIPLFKKQIAEGGPVTVTHPEIIRYFMTIPEAAQLVIQAGAMAQGGEIFVLDMGEPVKIVDLARDLIKLSGFEPDVDIPIEFIGLRPGEKLYEELLLDEEGITSTRHEKIFIGKPIFNDYKLLMKKLENLRKTLNTYSNEELKEYLTELVPTYRRDSYIDDINNNEVAFEIAVGHSK
ncbi:nucleoside-diphosphate sugar epimerase [Caloranaerobacter sp. TR13]|uniref:polysaccharide biosynthesis protein n=1 Tax=Caloranaerobacter sp. TR13 TaxID=1302151 RepID=UPI0006D45D41|nr:nucleoside-diphosphate sugar epimerase/dehydratase [Caloranaerobacter sp. TR13]KPU27360.1 nucleoside-diphosphate sugar epimerase [Caloranaerobacter sp. TR13]